MATIHEFYSGKILRKATEKEIKRYKKDLSRRSEDEQRSGEVPGKPYGYRFSIYIQDFPIGGFEDEE